MAKTYKEKFARTLSVNNIMRISNVFGFYYNAGCNRFISLTSLLYSVCYAISMTYLSVINHRYIFLLSNALCIVVEYNINVFITFLTNGNYFYKYCVGVREIDESIGLNAELFENIPVSRFIFFVVFTARLVCFIALIFMYHPSRSFGIRTPNILAMNVLYFSLSMSYFPRIMLFEMVLKRFENMRRRLKKALKGVDLDSDQAVRRINIIKVYLNSYGKLIDNLNRVKLPVKTMILINSSFSFIRTMIVCYVMISHGKHSMSTFQMIEVILHLTLLCVPVVVAEYIANEVEEIKLILTQHLLNCEDNEYCAHILDALTFLETRPFRYTVLRAFSVDISLILGLLSLCTTYFIAVVQFSHIYD